MTAKPLPQLLVTASADSCAHVQHHFPGYPVISRNDCDIGKLAGRNLILVDCPDLAEQCATVAASVLLLPEIPLPSNPAVALKWAKAHKITYESATQPPNGGTGDSPSTPPAKAVVADPIESAPQSHESQARSETVHVSHESAGADPTDGILDLADDTFTLMWEFLTPEQRESVGKPGYDRANMLAMKDIAGDTWIVKALKADQEPRIVTTGDDPDEDIPEGHPAAESPPDAAYEGVNGYNGHDSYRETAYTPSGQRIRVLSEGWGEPVDLLQIVLSKELDLSILPPRLADRHGDISRRTGCDAGISTITDYCGYAALADDHYRAQPRALDWKFTQRPGFFSLSVGDSASRKSAAMEAALETVFTINAREGEKAVRGLVEYGMAQKMYEANRADYVRENKKLAVRPPPPPEPASRRGACAAKSFWYLFHAGVLAL